MNPAILDDLKSRYGERVLLSPSDLVDLLGVSEGQQANLRSAGKFPIATRKIGASVRVSIYDLAKYLSGEAEVAACTHIKQIDVVGRVAKKKAKGRLEGAWWIDFQTRVFAILDRRGLDAKIAQTSKRLDTFRV